MPGFSRLSVSGFRRLRNLDLTLRPMNVLIGANGVGKTSVLHVLRLLAGSANGRLEQGMVDVGGMRSLLTADGKTDVISFSIETTKAPGPPFHYHLNMVSMGYGYSFGTESLTSHATDWMRPKTTYIESAGARIRYHQDGTKFEPKSGYQYLETSLAQVPKQYEEAEAFRQSLADMSVIYHGLDVSARAAIRTPQTLRPALTPGANGEDLVSCLFTMSQTSRERFAAIEDALRAAFPAFERLHFPPVAAGRLTLEWREETFVRAFDVSELSEGTLRFLWLVTLLQSPGLPKITLIDEPEVGLHPEMLRLLAELMREASCRSQLVIATHSDRLVRFLAPTELLVCDYDETGGMTAIWADTLDNLNDWLAEYTLDQLWSKGVLGGRS